MTDNSSAKLLVDIRNVHFSRGARAIFRGIDLDVPTGKITVIMGPSGTGKTTLLKMIGGQIKPASGEVLFDGEPVNTLGRQALYDARKRMGMLFQSGALLTDLSVFDNVAFPLREHTDLPESLLRHLVLTRLQSVGLRNARDLMPAELSGGMARRVALARALILDPELILYDEPFTGQDPISLGILLSLIETINDALGVTSVVVTHDIKQAMSVAHHVHIISAGKVVESGSPQSVRASQSEWVQQFIAGKSDGPVPFHFPGTAYEDDLFASRGPN